MEILALSSKLEFVERQHYSLLLDINFIFYHSKSASVENIANAIEIYIFLVPRANFANMTAHKITECPMGA